MKILFLTSSRADFSIYEPLLEGLKNDTFFEVKILAFGTHLSKKHGYTADYIRSLGYQIDFEIDTTPQGDQAYDISDSIGKSIQLFAKFWQNHGNEFDWVFCLGDRYEMFAAIIAAVPFGIPFAHLHGGETSLGAIDQIFRHAISLSSQLHFVATQENKARLCQILGHSNGIHWVGSLALDRLNNFNFFSKEEFKQLFNFDFNKKAILVTIHPETVNLDRNIPNIKEMIKAIGLLHEYQFLVTLPNADTDGNKIRMALYEANDQLSNICLVENLGTKGYFSAMKWAKLLVGNTSSGIIEAASFGKYVINLGDRQLGRQAGPNVLHLPFDAIQIVDGVQQLEKKGDWEGGNVYFKEGATQAIITILKNE